MIARAQRWVWRAGQRHDIGLGTSLKCRPAQLSNHSLAKGVLFLRGKIVYEMREWQHMAFSVYHMGSRVVACVSVLKKLSLSMSKGVREDGGELPL